MGLDFFGDKALDKAINSIQVDTSAMDYAKSSGLSQRAKEGMGASWMNNMLESKVAGLRGQENEAMAAAAQRISSSGMGLSSIGSNAITGAGMNIQAQISDAAQAIQQENDAMKLSSQNQFGGIIASQANMELQAQTARANLEAQRSSMFDRVMQVGAVAGALMNPAGAAKNTP